jgi:PPM family protein phosphatase
MLRVAEGWFARSDTGRQRRANEDSYMARAPLFVVADGMGGARAGEVASKLAVESYEGGLPQSEGTPEQRLADQARQANARIHDLSRRESDLHGMGTTLTAVYADEDEVSIAHVGDSRAYCLRDGELQRLTDDHSLVGELVRQGRLTPEEASEHPQRSIITRALGPEPDVAIDTRTLRARPGDVYLLCSDGLTSMIDEGTLAEILRSSRDLRRAGQALIRAANDAGGNDNITVVLFSLEEVGSPATQDAVPVGDQPTTIGDAELGDELRAGLQAPAEASPSVPPKAAAPGPDRASPASMVRPRQPRMPSPSPPPARRRRRRVPVTLIVLLALAGLVGAGGYIASQTVYFVGTNRDGLVTLYRGLPYDLPAGVQMYTPNYVSGVSAQSLSAARRRKLLDHKLRSHDDGVTLVRQLERGQLSG